MIARPNRFAGWSIMGGRFRGESALAQSTQPGRSDHGPPLVPLWWADTNDSYALTFVPTESATSQSITPLQLLGVHPLQETVTRRTDSNEKGLRETQTLRAGCSKAEPKKISLAADPFPGAQDSQNLISWRRSLPLPTDSVLWRSMDAISSYRGNRPTLPLHQTANQC